MLRPAESELRLYHFQEYVSEGIFHPVVYGDLV